MQSDGFWFTPADYNPATGMVHREDDNASLRTMAFDLQAASFLESPYRLGRIEDGQLSMPNADLNDGWHGQFSTISDRDGNPRLVGLIIRAGQGEWPDRPVGLSGVVIARSPAYANDLAIATEAMQ